MTGTDGTASSRFTKPRRGTIPERGSGGRSFESTRSNGSPSRPPWSPARARPAGWLLPAFTRRRVAGVLELLNGKGPRGRSLVGAESGQHGQPLGPTSRG